MVYIGTGCPRQSFYKGGPAGTAPVRRDKGLPHACHSRSSWAKWTHYRTQVSPSEGASGKAYLRKSRKCHRERREQRGWETAQENVKVREGEQGAPWQNRCSLQPKENPCWSRFLLKNWSQWTGSTLQQQNSVKRKQLQKGNGCVLTVTVTAPSEWDRVLRSEGVNVSLRRECGKVVLLIVFISYLLWIYFNWQ